MKIKSAFLAAALVVTGMAIGGEAAFAFQGHMFNAKADLQAARAQLNMAIPDKDGHRVNAIGLVDQALMQTNMGIRAGAQ